MMSDFWIEHATVGGRKRAAGQQMSAHGKISSLGSAHKARVARSASFSRSKPFVHQQIVFGRTFLPDSKRASLASVTLSSWTIDRTPDWVKYLSNESVTESELTKLIQSVSALLDNGEEAHLTAWVGPLLVRDLNLASGVTLLRASFNARNLLPFWSALRDRIAQKLTEQGRDPGKVLRGLYA